MEIPPHPATVLIAATLLWRLNRVRTLKQFPVKRSDLAGNRSKSLERGGVFATLSPKAEMRPR